MLNKVIIMGRLTAAPELKTTTSGTSVCSFRVAVERRYQKEGEERQTDFINVVAWGKTAEFVSRYFQKGRMINVVGNLQTRNYEDKGVKRYVTEVVAEEINFCGDSKREASTDNEQDDSAGFAPFELPDDVGF